MSSDDDFGAAVYSVANYRNQTVFDYESYVFQTLNLTTANSTQQLCHGQFCCNFNISVGETSAADVYRYATAIMPVCGWKPAF